MKASLDDRIARAAELVKTSNLPPPIFCVSTVNWRYFRNRSMKSCVRKMKPASTCCYVTSPP